MTTKTIPKSYENCEGVEVIFFDGEIEIGTACTASFEGKINNFLHGVEVNEKYRNNGYGYAIVAYMVDKYGVDTLYVAADNTVAIELYKKFGFRIVQSFDENHVVMRRTVYCPI